MIPTKEQNPEGLHSRYEVRPLHKQRDPNAEYFVLRLDDGGSDPKHIAACRKAVLVYAEQIQNHLPDLAKDLKERYGKEG